MSIKITGPQANEHLDVVPNAPMTFKQAGYYTGYSLSIIELIYTLIYIYIYIYTHIHLYELIRSACRQVASRWSDPRRHRPTSRPPRPQ